MQLLSGPTVEILETDLDVSIKF